VSEANGHISREQIVLTGSANIPAGSVLGKVAVGTSAGSAGLKAFGLVTLAKNPVDGDTIAINGTTITMKSSGATGAQVNIGSTPTLTAAAILAYITAHNISNVTCTASGNTGILVTASAVGTAANSYALATSNTDAFTLSGATLLGGTAANTGDATVTAYTVGSSIKPGTYKAICVTATTANVFDPDGDLLGVATFATPFTDAQINLTITAGSTPCVAGDTFYITPATGAGKYKPVTASATDGSQVASAILYGTTDVTSADKNAVIMARHCEVNLSELIWDSSMTPGLIETAKTQLASKSIICR